MDIGQVRAALTTTPRRRRATCIVAALFALWLLLCVAAWLAGPGLLRDYAVKYVREEFGHELAIGEVKVNPWLLAITVQALELRDPAGRSLVSFRELHVDVQAQTLVRAMVVLDEFRLDGLVVHVERIGPDRFNFSALADRLAERAAAAEAAAGGAPAARVPAEDGPAVNFLVRHTALNDAAFHFVDHTHVPVFENWLRPINLAMDDLTSRPDREAPYDIKASIGSGGTVGWRGDLSLQPLRSQGRLQLDDFGLKAAHEYMQSQFAFALPSGRMNVRIDYLADFSGTQSVLQVTDGQASIDQLEITDPDGNPLFAFEQTLASGIVADLVQSTASINLLETRGGRVEAVIAADGSTNIQRALLPPPGAAVAAAEQPVVPVSAPGAPVAAQPPAATPPWKITLARAAIRDYRLHLVDNSTRPAADLALEQVNFELSNLRLPDPAPLPFDFSAVLAAGGRLEAKGEYALDTGAVRADIVLDALALAPFSPYLAGIGRLSVTDGRANWRGRLSAQANGTRDLRVEGAGSLQRLAVRDDVSKTKLLRLGELGIDGLVYEDRVPRLTMRRLLLANLDLDLVLDRNGTSNLQQVFMAEGGAPAATASSPAAAGKPAPAAKPMTMRLDSFVLRDNTVNFRDASPDLSFAAQLTGFGGRIDGLSSDPAKRATVDLAGTIDRYAPLTVQGEINPLAAISYSDVRVRLSSLDVGALTPYTVTWLAYPLERGKLGIELDWKIAERKFDSQNRVLIDGLALGEKREAPRATKLPVKLGIALLTNREGDADLSVPAYGELDDPKFRIGRVILAALGNLVTRAVTSPFAALGGLGGDDDKAGKLAFRPGTAAPEAGEEEKLAKLAQALADRPMLSLAITGTASTSGDRLALQRNALEIALKRQYLDSPFRRGQTVDEVTLGAGQRAAALAALYRKTTGQSLADLRDAQGNPLPVAAQQAAAEEKLLGGIAIDDGALRELARNRAQFAKDRLLAAGVPEVRLFVVDGEILPANGETADAPVLTRLALDAK